MQEQQQAQEMKQAGGHVSELSAAWAELLSLSLACTAAAAVSQIAFADRVLLNKSDLVSPASAGALPAC